MANYLLSLKSITDSLAAINSPVSNFVDMIIYALAFRKPEYEV